MGIGTRISNAFPALQHRNFRLFWTGQCFSLIGTWMQNVAQGWLVLQLTGSAWLLGVVSALQFAPMLFLALFAGVVVDRFPKRRILIITQTILMLQAFILSLLTWLGIIQYWEILLLSLSLGLVTTIDHPTRQAYVIEMVGKEDLMNAIALNSSIFNAARVVGPAIAGLMMSVFSTAFCFLVNGLSFVAVITGLFMISETTFAKGKGKNMMQEVKEGLSFAKGNASILSTLSMVAVTSIFAVNFTVLVPVFAQGELGQQAGGYGLLVSAIGVGALAGAIYLAVISKAGPKMGLLPKAGLALGSVLIFLGWQRLYWLSFVLLAFAGGAMIVLNASANTTLQLNTPDHLRGRVMSLFSLVLGGLTPFGSLYSGAMAGKAGAGKTFIFNGVIVVLMFTWFKFRQGNHPKPVPKMEN